MVGASLLGIGGAVAGIAIGTVLSVGIWAGLFWLSFKRRPHIGADNESIESVMPTRM
jgi:hypothetical protein